MPREPHRAANVNTGDDDDGGDDCGDDGGKWTTT